MSESEEIFSPDLIIPGIYLGDWRCAKNKASLDTKSIKNILNITKNRPNLFESEYNYLFIQAADEANYDYYQNMEAGVAFLHNCLNTEKGNVLVHCEAGISRSTTVVLAYLIKHKNYTLKDAYIHTKSQTTYQEQELYSS